MVQLLQVMHGFSHKNTSTQESCTRDGHLYFFIELQPSSNLLKKTGKWKREGKWADNTSKEEETELRYATANTRNNNSLWHFHSMPTMRGNNFINAVHIFWRL